MFSSIIYAFRENTCHIGKLKIYRHVAIYILNLSYKSIFQLRSNGYVGGTPVHP